MNHTLSQGIVLAGSVALLLLAAKAHGRQLRLEREQVDHWQVQFGADNPAFVETLWRRERWVFWSTAAGVALAGVAYALLGPRWGWRLPAWGTSAPAARWSLALLTGLWSLSLAFVATGLWSWARFLVAWRRGAMPVAAPAEWLSGAVWGSVTWWLLTIGVAAALALWTWRRPT